MKIALVLAVFAALILLPSPFEAKECWKWISCQIKDFRAQSKLFYYKTLEEVFFPPFLAQSKKVECIGECAWWQCTINRVLYSGHGCMHDNHKCIGKGLDDVS